MEELDERPHTHIIHYTCFILRYVTLKMVNWTIFESEEEDDKNVVNLVGQIQDAIKTTEPEQKIREIPVSKVFYSTINSENFMEFKFVEVRGTKFEETHYKSPLSGVLWSLVLLNILSDII